MPARRRLVCENARRVRQHFDSRVFLQRNRLLLRGGKSCWVRGLAVSLKGVFFPTFSKPTKQSGNSSLSTGRLVHRQVEDWVLGKPVKKPHRFTLQIQQTLRRMGLVPVDAEIPLLSFKGHFLTKSDMFCRRLTDNGLVVVSLKTGHHKGMLLAGKREPCLGVRRPNCYKTHHHLQLGLEVASIEEDYGVPVEDAFVIYAGWGTQTATTTKAKSGTAKSKAPRAHGTKSKAKPKRGPQGMPRVDRLEPWARQAAYKKIMFDRMRADARGQFTMPQPGDVWHYGASAAR